MPSDVCPTRDVLSGYVLGTLSEDAVDGVSEHVETCVDCEMTVEEIERQPEGLVKSLRQPFAREEYLDESECRRVVARAEAMGRDSSVASVSSVESLVDEHLGDIREYQLLEKLGEGGMGVVYRAWHTKLKRVVALKILSKRSMANQRAVARFEREMEALGRGEHPNVVRAIDAGEEDGTQFLAMEYIDGLDLSQLARRCGPLPIADACELIRQAAQGLQYVHEHGLVHRDIKPSNLILTGVGSQRPALSADSAASDSGPRLSTPVVKILDFGLALLQGRDNEDADELTGVGQVMGTLDYMAPEQGSASHDVDIRADIYSLGATLYMLLCGRAPFADEKYDTPLKKWRALSVEAVRPIRERRPEIPKMLAAVLHRMLDSEPQKRFAAPADVAAALTPFATASDLPSLMIRAEAARDEAVHENKSAIDTEKPISSPSAGTPSRGPVGSRPAILLSWCRRNRVVIAVCTLAVAAFGFYCSPQIIRIITNEGQLVIKTDDPNIEVRVRQDGVTIVDWTTDRRIDLKVGSYEVELPQTPDGLRFLAKEFTLTRGGREVVDVSREMAASGTRDPERGPKTVELAKPFEITIDPEPLDVKPGDPMGQLALVTDPEPIAGVLSWTLETRAHRGEVYSVVYHPEQSLLATACDDGAIRFWDLKTGKCLRILLGHDSAVRSLTWSPDGKHLASGGMDKTIRLWDVFSGRLLRTHTVRVGGITKVAWSPDTRWLASGGEDGTVRIWDVLSDKMTHELSGHSHEVKGIVWLPDGKTLASGGDNTVRLWDAETGEELYVVEHSFAGVEALAASPDGRVLAAPGWDTRQRVYWIEFWDARTGVPIEDRTVYGNGSGEFCLVWSPDGKWLLGGVYGVPCQYRIYDATKGKLFKRISHEDLGLPDVRAVAYAPDGLSFAVADKGGTVQVCDSVSYTTTLTLPRHTTSVVNGDFSSDEVILSPGGHYRVSSGFENDFVYVVLTDEGQQSLTETEFAEKYGWQNDPSEADGHNPLPRH